MVILADAISVLFPAAVPLRDYTLVDDGSGPRIAAWHLPDPQPTPEQLAAVTPEQVDAARKAVARDAALSGLLTRPDDTAVGVRLALFAVVDLVNLRLAAMGQAKVLLPEILGYIAANPTLGDPH